MGGHVITDTPGNMNANRGSRATRYIGKKEKHIQQEKRSQTRSASKSGKRQGKASQPDEGKREPHHSADEENRPAHLRHPKTEKRAIHHHEAHPKQQQPTPTAKQVQEQSGKARRTNQEEQTTQRHFPKKGNKQRPEVAEKNGRQQVAETKAPQCHLQKKAQQATRLKKTT